MNSTTMEPSIAVACLPVHDNIPLLSTNIRRILAAMHIFIMSAGTPANVFVTYLIYTTKQYKNQSTRLIMYLSIVDIFGTSIINGVPAFYMISYYEAFSCFSLLTMDTFVNSSISITYMMTVGIAFDRMMKIRYLNEYSSKMTPFRFRLVIVCLFICAGVQTFLVFTGIFFFGYGYAIILSTPLHVVCSVFLVACHVSSIKKLKAMSATSQTVSASDRSIVRIASLHFAIFVVCLMPILVCQLVRNIFLSKITSEVIDILVISFLYVLVSLHSTLNAFMFLYVNREARRKVMVFLQRVNVLLFSMSNRLNGQVAPMEIQPEPGHGIKVMINEDQL